MMAVMTIAILPASVNAAGLSIPVKKKGAPFAVTGVPIHKTYALIEAEGIVAVNSKGIYQLDNIRNKIYFTDQATGKTSLVVDGRDGDKGYPRKIKNIYSVGETIILLLGGDFDKEYSSYYATLTGTLPSSIKLIDDAREMYDFGESETYLWFDGAWVNDERRLYRYYVPTGTREYIRDVEIMESYMTRNGDYISYGSSEEGYVMNYLKTWKIDYSKRNEISTPPIPKSDNIDAKVILRTTTSDKVYIAYDHTIYQYPFTKDQPWECCKIPSSYPGFISYLVYNPVTNDFLAIVNNYRFDVNNEDENEYAVLFKHIDGKSDKTVHPCPSVLELPTGNPYSPIYTIPMYSAPHYKILVDGHGNYLFMYFGYVVVYNPYGVVGYTEAVDKNPTTEVSRKPQKTKVVITRP